MSDARLRVAVLARSVLGLHGLGGLERHVADLVVHLDRLGVEVTLVTPPPRRAGLTAPLPARHVSVPYRSFPGAGRRGTTVLDRSTAYPVFGWRAGRLAARLARSGTVDVVHGFGASVLGYALARRRDASLTTPLVLNPQGMEEFGATDPGRAPLKRIAYWPLQMAVRMCARQADAIIATDSSLRRVVTQHLRVPDARTVTLPNAIDLDVVDRLAPTREEATACRLAAGTDAASWLLLSVGRLEQSKGFHVMLAALGRLGDRVPGWRWVLVGDGPWRARLARQAAGAGLASRIMMPGRVDERTLHAWYDACDLFVHPTLYEGSSLVTLEAMAHGRAIVATRAGGLPDKVRPGENGWLVAPGDAAALAEAVSEACANRARLADLGARSRAIVEAEFAWPAVARATLALYRTLLEARAARRDTSARQPSTP